MLNQNRAETRGQPEPVDQSRQTNVAAEELDLEKERRPIELSIHGFLLLCAVLSIFVTLGIAVILFREAWTLFGNDAIGIVEFFTSTSWQPTLGDFGVLPLLNATLIYNMASAGIVVGMLIIPMLSSLSEDALFGVPQSLREAAYALRVRGTQVVVLQNATDEEIDRLLL